MTLAIALFGLVSGVSAATSTEAQNQVMGTGLGNQASATSTTATSTKTMTAAEKRLQLVRNFTSKMENRFNVNIRTLESLSARIASRVAKLDQAGKDTAQAKTKLAEANAKIQEAKDALAKMQQDIESAISTVQPKKAFELVKNKTIKVVMEKIKEAHKALVSAIVTLAKVNGGSNETATSTPVAATSTTVTATSTTAQ